MTIDGYESPLTLRARPTISGEGIRVDFAGSSPMVARGINVPKPIPMPIPPSACAA